MSESLDLQRFNGHVIDGRWITPLRLSPWFELREFGKIYGIEPQDQVHRPAPQVYAGLVKIGKADLDGMGSDVSRIRTVNQGGDS